MTDLERQLTAALNRLSGQYETEQQRHSGQIEAPCGDRSKPCSGKSSG